MTKLKPEPIWVDNYPMCDLDCHYHSPDTEDIYNCRYDKEPIQCYDLCAPAIRELVEAVEDAQTGFEFIVAFVHTRTNKAIIEYCEAKLDRLKNALQKKEGND